MSMASVRQSPMACWTSGCSGISRSPGKILRAGDLVGEHRPDQVLGAHAGELRRHLAAAAKARQSQRNADRPIASAS